MFVLSICLPLNQCSVATIIFERGKKSNMVDKKSEQAPPHPPFGAMNLSTDLHSNSLIQLSSLDYAVMFG